MGCGRYVGRHADHHSRAKKHPLVFDVNERTIYCYTCDDYVMNDQLNPEFDLLRTHVQGVQEGKIVSSTRSGVVMRQTPETPRLVDKEDERLFAADHHFRMQVTSKVFHAWKKVTDQDTVRLVSLVAETPRGAPSVPPSAAPSARSSPTGKKGRMSPGQTGLRNLGNTCFMNACLQCLSHTHPFTKYILNLTERQNGLKRRETMDLAREVTVSLRRRNAEPEVPDGQELSLAVNTYNLFRVMWSSSGKWPVVTPSAFLSSVWSTLPDFQGYLQHDALEFLCNFLDKLDADLRAKRFFYRIRGGVQQTVVSLFEGKVLSQVVCDRCKTRSTREQLSSFLTLDLDFNNNEPEASDGRSQSVRGKPAAPAVDLTDCLAHFVRTERIEGYECDKCKTAQRATKRVGISEFPDVLLLHINRIRWKGVNRQKIQTKVDFLLEDLNMAPYRAEGTEAPKIRYSLCGVVNHSGRHFGSGHYFCYCLNNESGGWLRFEPVFLSSFLVVVLTQLALAASVMVWWPQPRRMMSWRARHTCSSMSSNHHYDGSVSILVRAKTLIRCKKKEKR